MAALTDNIAIARKEGEIISHPCAVDIIYQGALVKHNAAGYLAPCATEAGATFAGVAVEKVDNSGGSAGDLSCQVYKSGVFLLTGSGFSQADVGEIVYASDDQTITTTEAANLQIVGKIVAYYSSTQVWVSIMTNMAPAATVAELGSTANLTALAVSATDLTTPAVTATNLSDLSTGDSYTDAAVNAIFAEVETALDLKADNADLVTMEGELETALDLKCDNADAETLRTEVEARLDAIETAVDAIIAALKGSGIMLD